MGFIVFLLKIILAILLPPLAVLIETGCSVDLLINVCLTLLGWIPGKKMRRVIMRYSDHAKLLIRRDSCIVRHLEVRLTTPSCGGCTSHSPSHRNRNFCIYYLCCTTNKCPDQPTREHQGWPFDGSQSVSQPP